MQPGGFGPLHSIAIITPGPSHGAPSNPRQPVELDPLTVVASVVADVDTDVAVDELLDDSVALVLEPVALADVLPPRPSVRSGTWHPSTKRSTAPRQAPMLPVYYGTSGNSFPRGGLPSFRW